MPQDDGSLFKFIAVAFIAPVIYASVNGGIRRITSGEKKAENVYLGTDIALAAFISVLLYTLEPQTRILPPLSWESPEFIRIKREVGPGVAVAIDFGALVWAMCIHTDYLTVRSKVPNPTKWHKFCTGFANLFWNNFLGLVAFAQTAFFLRG